MRYANDGNAEPRSSAKSRSPSRHRTEAAGSGMELPPAQFSSQPPVNSQGRKSPSMATLAMMRPSSLLPAPREMNWDERGLPNRTRSPASQRERIELPSIQQAIPEIRDIPDIQSRSRGDSGYPSTLASYSPRRGAGAAITPPAYTQSPPLHKRRRLSNDEDQEAESRERSIPRLYRSPSRAYSGPTSPTNSGRRASSLSTTETWAGSARTSPHISGRGLSAMRSPSFGSSSISRSEWRPTLPSLPILPFDRASPQPSRGRSTWSEYALDTSRLGAETFPHLPSYSTASFPYGYQQPRGSSFSGPSTAHHSSHDRTPFASSNPHARYPDWSMPDLGNDKQRKRRGNLPKETTDKLRAWFALHLQHPYPTEDEKQDLMRQTGLQMNQISNWFINARRRQLPAMINNARAEADARHSRRGEGALHGESTSDYREGRERRNALTPGESDGEGSGYEEEYGGSGARKRDSI